MKTYQELTLSPKNISDAEVIEIFKTFTQQYTNWTFLLKETEEHTTETGNSCCVIFLDDDYHRPNFLITKIKSNFYSIVNIFNSQHGYITMLEHNALLRLFKQDFQVFLKSGKYKSISVKVSNENIGLNKIISIFKSKRLF